MRRRAIVVAAVATVLAWAAVDLGACGDKYLKPGKGTRVRRYAAVHPASILVYKSTKATEDGVKFYRELLTRAGHTPVFLDHGASIANTVAGGKYDLVLTMYADAATVKSQLDAVAAKPDVLPILYQPTKALEAQAVREYPHLILPHKMYETDVIDQIDHLMERRLSAASGAVRPAKGH
jgi:hypothetical protein